jgi:site-specific DNA-methyltransferase (adenine-specific)
MITIISKYKIINRNVKNFKINFFNIQIVTGSKEALFKIIGDFNKNIKDIIIWDKGHGQPAMHKVC